MMIKQQVSFLLCALHISLFHLSYPVFLLCHILNHIRKLFILCHLCFIKHLFILSHISAIEILCVLTNSLSWSYSLSLDNLFDLDHDLCLFCLLLPLISSYGSKTGGKKPNKGYFQNLQKQVCWKIFNLQLLDRKPRHSINKRGYCFGGHP